jgi:hypothetical protein
MEKRNFYLLLVITILFSCLALHAQTTGHYLPGVMNIRDNIQPPPGMYLGLYDPYYFSKSITNEYGDEAGNFQESRTLDFRGFPITFSTNVDLSVDFNSVGSSPTFIWVTDEKILGANFGLYIAPYVGYESMKLNAKVTATIDTAGIILPNGSSTSEYSNSQSVFGIGDTYVQPIWMAWHGTLYDISLGYGVYIPTGSYNSDSLVNMGYGFWSHELIFDIAFYLAADQATAFVLNTTFETNSHKENVFYIPGDNLILEYGISQYFSNQLEIGICGSSLWQVSNDVGLNEMSNFSKTSVSSIGGEIYYWAIYNKFSVSYKYNYQYSAKSRFKGQLMDLNFLYVF